MKAVVVSDPGGPEALELVERPDPEPEPDELAVAVHATAVNRADVMQRQGKYPPPAGASDVLGLEMAGEVVAVGSDASDWSVGDRVCAVLAGGGYAETVTLPASTALPVPDGMSYTDAAALPEVFTTAYDNLFNRGGLRAGQVALVHGGSSGVGTAAVQLAAHFGAYAVATARSQAKLDACTRLGAWAGINYAEADFVAEARSLTDERGVEVILDVVGADYLSRNLSALAVEGHLVIIGLISGAKAEINLAKLLGNRLSVQAATLRARSVAEKAALADQMRREVWPAFASGALRPVVDRVLPLSQAAEGHRAMEAGDHVGKIVLSVV
jgi:putative PIG3 family NAD(P)H quinone oxidoreductase